MYNNRLIPASEELILEMKGVSKTYPDSASRSVTALENVDLHVFKGETLGIVGESGSGKSTLAKVLLQLTPADSGQVYYRKTDLFALKGEQLRQIRRHIQAVFQDVTGSFNPRMKVKDILCSPLKNYGLIRRADCEKKAFELLSMVELPGSYANQYIMQLSGGERQRVGIGRALALRPEILVWDEATSALDVTIQKNITDMMKKLQGETQVTMLFICHDLALAQSMCHRIAVVYGGRVVEVIEGSRLSGDAEHPYTRDLLSSVFSIYDDKRKEIPNLGEATKLQPEDRQGCLYRKRCKNAVSLCERRIPGLSKVNENHFVACHNRYTG